MKFVLAHFSTAKEPWCEKAVELYSEKISHFVPFEVMTLKPKKASRDEQTAKVRSEGETFLAQLKEGDLLVVFDERGQSLTSEKFAQIVGKLHDSGKKRVIFLIGGAYGVDPSVIEKAHQKISLAPFVMNHLVAQTVALEQIYRSFTILRGLPYHNK